MGMLPEVQASLSEKHSLHPGSTTGVTQVQKQMTNLFYVKHSQLPRNSCNLEELIKVC